MQCVNTSGPYKRAFHSEDREISSSGGSNSSSSRSTPRNVRAATLSGGERRVSLPTGHYSATLNGRMPSEARAAFKHYGSSLSLADHGTHELTSRTLRPPSPTTLRKSSTSLPPSAGLARAERTPRPSLPNMRVELESPKLADYLERPRLVNAIPMAVSSRPSYRNEAAAALASAHHAKRYENSNGPAYRNLRLGNFMEEESTEDDELIPERLRQYYLDTYLNVCDTCESLTHCNPMSPIVHRGM